MAEIRTAAEQADALEMLETLAFREAAGHMPSATGHNSRIARVASRSWHARVIAQAKGVAHAATPDELRALMDDPAVPVIFLPHDAMVTAAIIQQACLQSGLGKMLVWETDEAWDI